MFEKDKKQEEKLKNNPVSNDNDLHIKDEVYDNKRHEKDHETQIKKQKKLMISCQAQKKTAKCWIHYNKKISIPATSEKMMNNWKVKSEKLNQSMV